MTATKNAGAPKGLQVPAVPPAAIWEPLSELRKRKWRENPRRDRPVEQVARAIIRWGFGAPLLARRENGELIAGHTRLDAVDFLRRLWKDPKTKGKDKWHPEAVALATADDPLLPVRPMDLSEEEAHALAIADNKLGEIAKWDDLGLGELLAKQTVGSVQAIGFDAKSLAKLGIGPEPSRGKKPARVRSSLTYSVMVECTDEEAQTTLLERLEGEGLKCKPLVT